MAPGRGYGYPWWLGTYTIKGHELDYIEARGRGGQRVSLVPELDLTVVFTCWAGPESADIGEPLITIDLADLDTFFGSFVFGSG